MTKAYVIVTETIHDPEGMKRYSEAAALSMVDVRPRPLVVDREVEVLEGEWPATQTVIMEFDSVEAAKTWYFSDAYQAAAKIRQAAADCSVVIAQGFEPAVRG